jgi:dephospho-CoA kinase
MRPPVPIIGLVGGIGAGKSLVAAEFARRGATVIAGDPAGHEALRQPEIRQRVVERWGSGVLGADGEVDRRALATIVFADAQERKALEEMVFPWIGRRLREQLAASQADPAVRWIVLDAAVMLEAGWNNVCDWIVYVDAPRELRLERLARQRDWTPAQLAAREAAQWSPEAKAAYADAVLVNAGDATDLNRSIDDLLARWGLPPRRETDPEIS